MFMLAFNLGVRELIILLFLDGLAFGGLVIAVILAVALNKYTETRGDSADEEASLGERE